MNKKKGGYIIGVLVIISALIILFVRQTEVHKAYSILDLEHEGIYYGLNCEQLKKIRGEPQKVENNFCDTEATRYVFEGFYLEHAAQVAYLANPTIKEYEVKIKNLTDDEGEMIFDKTRDLSESRSGKILKYEETINKGSHKMTGFISIPCAKYGMQFDFSQTKEIEWSYKEGEFNVKVSNPIDYIK